MQGGGIEGPPGGADSRKARDAQAPTCKNLPTAAPRLLRSSPRSLPHASTISSMRRYAHSPHRLHKQMV